MNDYITICIVTYNSSKYILEALESVRKQSYRYIDLIISDDESSDNTIEICKDWINTYRDRFRNASLVTTDKNTGTAGNLNRGIALCETEWIKCMAGDDALYPDFLEEFMCSYAGNTFDLLCTETGVYKERFDDDSLMYYYVPNPAFFNNQTSITQNKILLRCNLLGVSMIFRKKLFDSVGGFDERYQLIEDWPFFIKVTNSGSRIGMIPLLAMKYRISTDSVQTGVLSPRFENCRCKFYRDYILNNVDVVGRLLLKIRLSITEQYCLTNSPTDIPSSIKRKIRLLKTMWEIWEFNYVKKGKMRKILV